MNKKLSRTIAPLVYYLIFLQKNKKGRNNSVYKSLLVIKFTENERFFKMNQHIGSCRILLMAFQQLMPENLLSFANHLSSDDECFRNIINQFSEQAVSGNSLTAFEYAKIFKQVAEFFEPNPADSKTKVNQFNHQLRNILQIKFTDIR